MPLRPTKAEFRFNSDRSIIAAVSVKSYQPAVYESLIVRLEGYDIFESLVLSEEQTIRTLRNTGNNISFDFNTKAALLPGTIKYLEVYISAYSVADRPVRVTDGKKCDAPLAYQELKEYKITFGEDAITYFWEAQDAWRCVCGTLCSSEVCDMCGRTLEDMRNPNEKAAAIGRFLEQVQGSRDPNELKESLQALNGALNPAQYEEAVKYADSLISLKRMYNIDVGEKEREKLKSILG